MLTSNSKFKIENEIKINKVYYLQFWHFINKTPSIVWSDTLTSIFIFLFKSSAANTSSFVDFFFNSSNAFFCFSVQFHLWSFFTKS